MSQQGRQSTSVREKSWLPKALDVEQIVLTGIVNIMQAPFMVNDVGDMTKTNAAIEATVLLLDKFTSSWLKGNEDPDYEEYKAGRDEILKDWDKPGTTRITTVRELFGYAVESLARRRLFKTRKTAYFVYHWKVGMEAKAKQEKMPDLEELEKDLEETEGSEGAAPAAEEMAVEN